MVNAGHPAVVAQDSVDGLGKVAGEGGSSDLVTYHCEAVVGVGELHHCFHEVFAELRIEPCGADNHCVLTEGGEESLPLELGASVDALWIWLVFLVVRAAALSGEHIVGGDVYHLGAVSGGGLAEIANGSGVERGSLQIVGFGSVYGGVCGAIHYKVKFVFGETSANCIAVGDVKRVVVSVHGLYLRVILKFNP